MDTSTDRPVRTFVGLLGLLAGLLFGGMAIGLAIALGPGGGSVGAIVIGFFSLPLCFGLGMSAWRGVAGAWMIGGLARALIRSRGDEATFRKETVAHLRSTGGTLPGTWVFVPIALVVGALAGVAMAIAANGDRLLAGGSMLAASVAYGIILRRLARRGLLPLSEE